MCFRAVPRSIYNTLRSVGANHRIPLHSMMTIQGRRRSWLVLNLTAVMTILSLGCSNRVAPRNLSIFEGNSCRCRTVGYHVNNWQNSILPVQASCPNCHLPDAHSQQAVVHGEYANAQTDAAILKKASEVVVIGERTPPLPTPKFDK